MPHFPKPFFRPTRKVWYVQIDGKQVNLGPDQAVAFETYHTLMASRSVSPAAPEARTQAPPSRLVVVLVDEFLDFVQKHRAADTYRWYRDRLDLFCNSIPADLTCDQL
jgi:hypothetical protein